MTKVRLKIPLAVIIVLASLTSHTAAQQKVRFRVECSNLDGSHPRAIVVRGQTFRLNVYIQDIRPKMADGILAAFTDVLYNDARVSVAGGLAGGPDFFVASPATAVNTIPGEINEAGSATCVLTDGDPSHILVPQGERLLFSVQMSANEFGPAVLASDSTEDDPDPSDGYDALPVFAAITFFVGPDGDPAQVMDRLQEQDIDFGSTTLEIRLGGDANRDGFVDGQDFNIWNSNKFTSGKTWVQGDFNGDSVVDGSDFSIWNSNKFQSYVYPPQ